VHSRGVQNFRRVDGAIPVVKSSFGTRTRTIGRHSLLIALVVSFLACGTPAVRADESAGLDELTADLFRGLRERRLFRLAESYCLQKLSRPRLSIAVRTDLTIELARTLTEHATFSSEPEQSELWNQAKKTLQGVIEAEPTHPRRILFEVQLAMVPATAGEWYRWLAELRPDDPAMARRAADELGDALSRLRTLDARIAERLRKGSAARTPPGELTPSEWRSLGLRVRQRMGLVQLNLASLQPAESADRAAALLDAQKLLKPLADTPEDDAFVWTSRLALIECLRLSGDFARAEKTVETLESRSPPAEFGDRLIAEGVRILSAQRKFSEATVLLAVRERRSAALPAELGFLKARLLADQIQEGEARGSSGAVEDERRALEEQVERLRRETGGYWTSRAELLLEQVRDRAAYGRELAGLVRRGEAEFRAGHLDEAAALFGKVADTARHQGRGELAFQFAYKRASIEIEARRWARAAADLRELVERFPDHPKAAEAHLLAAYSLGRLYDEQETKPHREELTRVLVEHRRRYAGGATALEATWLLATLCERTGQTAAALELYREIPREHARGGAALVAMSRCYETILDQLRQSRQASEAQEREAIATLEAALPAAANSAAIFDRPQAEAALRLARILLRCRPPRYSAADGWLVRVQAALTSGEMNDPEAIAGGTPTDSLKSQAVQLRIISLAGQGKFQEARRQLEQLSASKPAEMLQVLEGLAPLTMGEKADPFHDLGGLQLEAALRLDEQRDRLDPPLRRRLDECLARGYAAAGQPRRAIEAYDNLLKDSPRDKRLLIASGELLLKCADHASLTQAQKTWRILETLSPAGSEEWLFARYNLCRSLLALRETAQACKLLKVTRLLYPKLGGKKLEADFTALEENCRKSK
jgi:TolA-binding protein